MFFAIVRKELSNHMASFRFWVGALLTIILAFSSTLIAAQDYDLRLESYQQRVSSAQRELQTVSVYSYLQPVAVRPPEPLSVLDQGFESRLGTEVAIHPFSIPVAATAGYRGNELLVSLPTVDLTTIVSGVLGLLALLLTHDSILGEREGGTLRAVFAHGVKRSTLLAGKLTGGLLTLCLPLAVGLLVTLSLFRFEAGISLTIDQWLRVAGLVGAYVAYLCLMLLLGLLISLHSRSTSRALGLSVLGWFVLTIVIPGAARAVAGDLVETGGARRGSEREIAGLMAEQDRRLAEELRRDPLRTAFSGHTAISFANGEHRAVRYRNGSAAYYDSLADYYRFEVKSGTRYASQVLTIQRRYEGRLRAGERLGTGLAVISPAFLLDLLSESFAGTSVAEYDRFLADCRRYRLTLLAYMERKGAFRSWRWFTDDPPGGLHPWPGYLGLSPGEVTPERVGPLFSRLSEPEVAARVRRDREVIQRDPARRLPLEDRPRFIYRGPEFSSSLRHGAAAAGVLLAFNVLAAAAVWARFRRYDLGEG
ncbi:MAG: type transport system permease protein [Acidobacteriota bacterium]|nr:type transport system permease protein [Acidobacteriota bacterium]